VIVPILLPLKVDSQQDPMKNVWFRDALSDPLTFNAMVTHAAVHLDALYGRESNQATLQGKNNTIRLINENLRQDPTSPSDKVIAAVGQMASNCVSFTIISIDGH
jgi:hypothetical protein